MRAARSLHGGLAHLFAVLIVLQFFLAGLGAFTTIHNKQFKDSNFDAHAALGSLMVVIALVIVIIALVGRWSPRATKLSATLFGLMILQFFLGIIGSGSAPVVGGLHAANALLVTGIAYLLVRDARSGREPAAAV
jgi:cytochrome bd-type quinol oxidase subunit 2